MQNDGREYPAALNCFEQKQLGRRLTIGHFRAVHFAPPQAFSRTLSTGACPKCCTSFHGAEELIPRKQKPVFPIGKLADSKHLREKPLPPRRVGQSAILRIFDGHAVDNHLQSIIVFGNKEKEDEHPFQLVERNCVVLGIIPIGSKSILHTQAGSDRIPGRNHAAELS